MVTCLNNWTLNQTSCCKHVPVLTTGLITTRISSSFRSLWQMIASPFSPIIDWVTHYRILHLRKFLAAFVFCNVFYIMLKPKVCVLKFGFHRCHFLFFIIRAHRQEVVTSKVSVCRPLRLTLFSVLFSLRLSAFGFLAHTDSCPLPC